MATTGYHNLLRPSTAAIHAATLNHTSKRYTHHIQQPTNSHSKAWQRGMRPMSAVSPRLVCRSTLAPRIMDVDVEEATPSGSDPELVTATKRVSRMVNVKAATQHD